MTAIPYLYVGLVGLYVGLERKGPLRPGEEVVDGLLDLPLEPLLALPLAVFFIRTGLDDTAIGQLLQAHDSLEAASLGLIAAANDAGGKDNISVILARASGGAGVSTRSWWPFRR